MPTLKLCGAFEVVIRADHSDCVIGEILHVVRLNGGSNTTPIGHFSASPRPALPEEAAHWRADVQLRDDIRYNRATDRASVDPNVLSAPGAHYPTELPERLAAQLLGFTSCTEPFLLYVHEGRNTSLVQRGTIWDE